MRCKTPADTDSGRHSSAGWGRAAGVSYGFHKTEHAVFSVFSVGKPWTQIHADFLNIWPWGVRKRTGRANACDALNAAAGSCSCSRCPVSLLASLHDCTMFSLRVVYPMASTRRALEVAASSVSQLTYAGHSRRVARQQLPYRTVQGSQKLFRRVNAWSTG